MIGVRYQEMVLGIKSTEYCTCTIISKKDTAIMSSGKLRYVDTLMLTANLLIPDSHTHLTKINT